MNRSAKRMGVFASTTATGFTVIELVVTLVLIGVIAAIGMPRFFDEGEFDERGFLDETISAMRYAQKRAIASGCTVRANIAANGYALFSAANAAACDNTAACSAGNYGTAVTSLVHAGGVFAGNAPTGVVLSPVIDVCFRPSGGTTLGGNTVVSVGARTFTVWAATGFAQ